MLSLFDSDADSSDSEDVDYVPSKAEADFSEASDEELVCSDEDADGNTKCLKKQKTDKRKSSKKEKCDDVSISSTKDTTKVEKKNPDDVWKSFLEEVNTEANNKSKNEISNNTLIQVNEKTESHVNSGIASLENEPPSTVSKIENQSQIEIDKKGESPKIFEFAGETLTVNEGVIVTDLNIASNSNSHAQKASNSSPDSLKQDLKRKGGLDSVLGTIMNKKQKLTTLQKTLIDWKSYKKDNDLEEELENYNKGKGGYLERQRFLQRSDLKSYELEKAARLSKMKKY